MLFTRIALASAVLAILPAMAHATALDLTYEAPAAEAAPQAAPATAKSLFPVTTQPPVTFEYHCKGPRCTYEHDLEQRHEDQTTQSWSIGFQ
ncbi:hypothetical protein SAMN04490179_3036 [Pseudomonas antarctica]|uniref:Uncharacterized protein n=1 Tax=Pseudomonas antarctica TaxID=219572 RepID=A0A1G9ZDI0_9PSED|nr:hypothetical protein [Pseudomonas antarctica]KAF2411164.1 hypothetical protein PSAN_36040 [Pseudomonas antarctica]SDN19418.1 hypothetical protein SAMN04490179_3036 [Pseudomonas antarctica]